MPLARIFTRYPERTADLSGQLKQQGYQVEVASPDQSQLPPADLEIEFEICERADVLDRAANLATELGADIAVAPGVLQIASKPVAQPPLEQIAAPVMPEPLSGETTPFKPQAAAAHDPEREFEAAFAPVIEMPAAMEAPEVGVIDIPVMEHEPLPPVAFLDEPAAAEPVVRMEMPVRVSAAPAAFSELVRPADPMPYLAQLTPFGTRANRAEQPLQSNKRDARPQEAPPVAVRRKKVLEDGARIAAQSWAGALGLAASTSAAVRDHFQEYKKRAQVRSAEARAQHAARLLDLEQRRADAQRRADELAIAREQAAARLMELVRQRDPGLPKETRASESQQLERAFAPVAPVVPIPTQPPQSVYARMQDQKKEDRGREAVPPAAPLRDPAWKPARALTATPIELWRNINPPLRAVLTGAAAISALFIMGIALGLFHSKAPLASTANPNPANNGVTVQTGGVTVPAGTARPQSTQPVASTQAQAKPQPGQPVASQQVQTRTTKPSPRVTRLVAEQSEKQIGDDVVIRHYSRPVPTHKPKQAGQQAGLKHFSDLDN
jgi:hypothetical protein